MDGHMKGTRAVCAEKSCGTRPSIELGDVPVRCKKMPAVGSIYCQAHWKSEHASEVQV